MEPQQKCKSILITKKTARLGRSSSAKFRVTFSEITSSQEDKEKSITVSPSQKPMPSKMSFADFEALVKLRAEEKNNLSNRDKGPVVVPRKVKPTQSAAVLESPSPTNQFRIVLKSQMHSINALPTQQPSRTSILLQRSAEIKDKDIEKSTSSIAASPLKCSTPCLRVVKNHSCSFREQNLLGNKKPNQPLLFELENKRLGDILSPMVHRKRPGSSAEELGLNQEQDKKSKQIVTKTLCSLILSTG